MTHENIIRLIVQIRQAKEGMMGRTIPYWEGNELANALAELRESVLICTAPHPSTFVEIE